MAKFICLDLMTEVLHGKSCSYPLVIIVGVKHFVYLFENLLAVKHLDVLNKAVWDFISVLINCLRECIFEVSPDSLAEHS